MSRLSHRFGGLRWRLTLSFFVVAWAAMMTLEGLFVIVPALVAMSAPQRPAALAQDLQQLTPRLAPYLAETPPDRSRLVATLATLRQPILITEGITENLRGAATIVPGDNAALYVEGTDGVVIAARPATSQSASDLAHIQLTPEAHAVVAAALRHGSTSADRVQSTAGGQTVAAAPITDSAGVTQGVLLLGADLAALARPVYLSTLVGLLPSAVLFGIIASVFGACFGLLTARGLTERLSQLTTAANAWSKGDFAASARDSSSDELGQLTRDLNRMAEQLQNLLRDRQQLAAVEERNRLARDLHDSVKQQLFALTMLLGSAQMEVDERTEARRIIGEAERVAGTAQQELSELIHALRPAALTNTGMSVALRELCEIWAKRSGIIFDAQIPGGLTLAPSAEQDVFRTVQEALANIARHSGATRVEVRAERQPDALLLRIRDNGRGFDVGRTDRQGVGLRSMRERIEGLGGTLSVSSSGGGTRVEMRIPLEQPQSALPEHAPSGETA
ncbi:MAG TPA: histidine kinase [Ktedonobacterales bacterium]|nr:histidine kinase [Ktedonobacterales bacterium]